MSGSRGQYAYCPTGVPTSVTQTQLHWQRLQRDPPTGRTTGTVMGQQNQLQQTNTTGDWPRPRRSTGRRGVTREGRGRSSDQRGRGTFLQICPFICQNQATLIWEEESHNNRKGLENEHHPTNHNAHLDITAAENDEFVQLFTRRDLGALLAAFGPEHSHVAKGDGVFIGVDAVEHALISNLTLTDQTDFTALNPTGRTRRALSPCLTKSTKSTSSDHVCNRTGQALQKTVKRFAACGNSGLDQSPPNG